MLRNRLTVALAALALAGGAAGCLETKCLTNEACPQGQVCNPSSGQCVDADGGVGDDGAADADAGDGATGCEGPSDCTDPAAPICDDTTAQCRGCEGAGECVALDSLTPLCDDQSGRCVACLDSASDCTADASPICDGALGACRGCAGGAECAALDSTAPLCDDVSGRCVACLDSASDCTASQPICDDTTRACRACAADPECAARNAAFPRCDTGAGRCVECLASAADCGGSEPVCDVSAHLCRGCEAHDECAAPLGGGVCDGATGACLPPSAILYVDASASCPGDGAAATPYCLLQDAVDAVTSGRSTILVAAGTYAPVDVVDAGSVWIVGEAGAEIADGINRSNVYVQGTTDLILESVSIIDGLGTAVGVECDGSISVHPTVTIRGSTVRNNAGGGVSLSQCNYTLVNNFIFLNGGVGSAYGGVSINQPGTPAVFAFNTLADNDQQFGEGGVVCNQPATIESSIVYGNVDGDLSTNCAASHTHTTGDGNPLFIGSGDYHLQPGSPCIDGGDPAATVTVDIDGEARPQGGGPDMGADEAG